LRATPYVWSRCKAYPWTGMNIEWQDEDWMIDQGVEEFRLKLLLHGGDWRAAGVPQAARIFNRPPAFMIESGHRGKLPAELSFLRVVGGSVRVEVLKRAEDGHGLILRAVETAGQSTRSHFRLRAPAVSWEAAFSPWEIKTFRILAVGVEEVSMLETRGIGKMGDTPSVTVLDKETP